MLRVVNLCLWLVNTFLLENIETKRTFWLTYGQEGWTILSNIFQPLTILYHFHAMVTYAEVIGHSYSSKYIGLQRPSKQEEDSESDQSYEEVNATRRTPNGTISTIHHRFTADESIEEI